MVKHAVSVTAALALMLAAGGALAAGMSGISAAQAKREIVGDGYTKVQNVHKAASGWSATALEGGKPVTVLVDSRGDVAKTK